MVILMVGLLLRPVIFDTVVPASPAVTSELAAGGHMSSQVAVTAIPMFA
jgi:hypothetical protein